MKEGRKTSFPKRSRQEWLELAGRDIRFSLAGEEYSAFHHGDERGKQYPPLTSGERAPWKLGEVISVGDDAAVANALALAALNGGAEVLLFEHATQMDDKQRDVLLEGIFLEMITVLHRYPSGIGGDRRRHIDLTAVDSGPVEILTQALRSANASFPAAPTFHLRVPDNYFLAIAQPRALRLCWQLLTEAYGTDLQAQIYLHLLADRDRDPNDNKIRSATLAPAALAPNPDCLFIEPSGGQPGTTFSRRIARNIHHLLREESHLAAAPDPAAGSYFLENLTESLAHRAWDAFRQNPLP